jgi:DNA-binding response OmpR family regulator
MSMNLEPSDDQQASPSALLVYAEFEPLHTLRVALASRGIDTWRARSCRQALAFLAKFRPVHVIFTDMILSDGTWLDLVRANGRTSPPVIVVVRKMDAGLWSEIIQRGAGLIVPPFGASDLIHPVRRSGARRCSKHGSPHNGSFGLIRNEAERPVARPEQTHRQSEGVSGEGEGTGVPASNKNSAISAIHARAEDWRPMSRTVTGGS